MKTKVVILAGGIGTRLWPLSRQSDPKQVKAFLDDQSIIQKTYAVLRQGFKPSDIFVATTKKLSIDIKKQLGLRASQFIIEPERRDTAAAIGNVAWFLEKKFSGCTVVTVSADHHIGNAVAYIKALKLAAKIASENPQHFLTVGIKPTYPETGYGYIKAGKVFKRLSKDVIYQVDSFKEKPNLQIATKYLKDKHYLWNASLFAFRASSLQQWFKKYLPQHYQTFESKNLRRDFKLLPKVSIDIGLIEKLKQILVIPVKFEWHDIGHWKTIADILPQDKNGNSVKGLYVCLDSFNNLIYSRPGKLVATSGLKNHIIVDTKDALLVCHKDDAQSVKKVVKIIKDRKLGKYL